MHLIRSRMLFIEIYPLVSPQNQKMAYFQRQKTQCGTMSIFSNIDSYESSYHVLSWFQMSMSTYSSYIVNYALTFGSFWQFRGMTHYTDTGPTSYVPPSSWVPCKKRPLPFLNVFGMTGPSSSRESKPQILLVSAGSPLSSPFTISRGYWGPIPSPGSSIRSPHPGSPRAERCTESQYWRLCDRRVWIWAFSRSCSGKTPK